MQKVFKRRVENSQFDQAVPAISLTILLVMLVGTLILLGFMGIAAVITLIYDTSISTILSTIAILAVIAIPAVLLIIACLLVYRWYQSTSKSGNPAIPEPTDSSEFTIARKEIYMEPSRHASNAPWRRYWDVNYYYLIDSNGKKYFGDRDMYQATAIGDVVTAKYLLRSKENYVTELEIVKPFSDSTERKLLSDKELISYEQQASVKASVYYFIWIIVLIGVMTIGLLMCGLFGSLLGYDMSWIFTPRSERTVNYSR